ADLNSFAFSKDGGVISTLVIEQTIREFFNDKVQTLDDRTLLYYKTIYRTFFYDLLMNTEKLTVLKSIKNKESYITTQGIDFTEIRSTIKTVINEHLNMTIKTINNRSFKSDATSMILSELVEGMNQKTFGHTYKNVEEFVETATEDATSQFKKLYTDIEKATDKAMGFFLTKFMYSMIFLIGQGDNSYIVNLIKSHILSAGAMGFLSMKTKYRTDSFGYAYDTSSKIISKTLNSFFFVHKKRLEKENEKLILENNLDRKLLEEFFEGKVKYSSYIDKVTLNFFEMERNIINEQNKDYNFFYGNRIKNDGICMFLNDVFKETSELKTLNDNVEAYLLTKFTQFDKGEKFCDEIPNIKYGYDERIWKKPFSYDSLNVARNGKITDVTKKRIIGENNVFNDLEKINKIVNNPVYDVMPDYEVLIKKRDLDEFGAVGFRNDFSISSVFLLKNVIKINIIIDPVTKIKTASITSVDVGKRIVDKTKDGAISVQVSTTKKTTVVSGSEDGLPILKTEDKETIELFSIESGDVIEIRLGSFRNKELDLRDETLNKDFRKSVVFRGTISSIKDGGGLINIDCVNTASVLYSISNKEVQIGSESLLSKATNFVTTSFSYLFGTRDKSITLDELNSYKEAKGCNNHLFEAIGDMDYNKLRGEQEECSMYNAAHFALGNLPSVSTNLITGGNLNNSGLASRKMVISQMSESFGIMSEIEDPRSKAINPDIYKNIYNVDKDYDTYGIMLQPVSETIIRDLTDEEYSKYNVYNNKKEDSYNSNAEFENKEENPSVNSSAENGVENSTIVEEIVGLPKGDVGFAWPTKSKLITSVFDMNRWHPELKKYKAHRAIDIGRLRDNKGQIVNSVNYIYASRDGVCTVGSNNKGAGRFVHIDHNLEIDGKKIPCFTFYCHLNTINVKQGQRVKAGDVIATMGASGLKDANQIHLHFEISINKEKIDPTIYLKGGKIK
ncbi:MAG: M23 family metallopeptidase, partial [Fusobacteriaceae bacterium]